MLHQIRIKLAPNAYNYRSKMTPITLSRCFSVLAVKPCDAAPCPFGLSQWGRGLRDPTTSFALYTDIAASI